MAKSIVIYSISRIDIVEDNDSRINDDMNKPSVHYIPENFGIDEDDLELTKHHFTFNTLLTHQQKEKGLVHKYSETNCDSTINTFWG